MKSFVCAILLLSSTICAEEERVVLPSGVYLGKIWRSYTAPDVKYERFYRITIYDINVPRVFIGLFVGKDESKVAWSYTEVEGETMRHVIAVKETEADTQALKKALEEIVDMPQGPSGGLDGTSIVIEFLRPELSDPVKTSRWQMEAAEDLKFKQLTEFQTGLLDLWKGLPNTLELRGFRKESGSQPPNDSEPQR